jgi:hypothetical protein
VIVEVVAAVIQRADGAFVHHAAAGGDGRQALALDRGVGG